MRLLRRPEWVREHAGTLLISLALALMAWLLAKSGELEETRLVVPVRVEPRDPRIEWRITPAEIPVIIRYRRDLLPYIASDNFSIEVDMTERLDTLTAEWKPFSLPLTDRNFVNRAQRSRFISLVKIGRDSSTVQVEGRWKARPAIVVPDIIGMAELRPGLQMNPSVRSTPSDVFIVGSDEKIALMPRDDETSRIRLSTARINIGNRTESFVETLPVILPDGVEIVQPRTSTAEVAVEITEVQTVKEIRDVPLDFSAVAPEEMRMEYEPRVATVSVFGPQSLLQKLDAQSFDVNLMRPGAELPGTRQEIPLEVAFSPKVPATTQERVRIRGVEPRAITVRYIAKTPEKTNPAETSTSPRDRATTAPK